MIVLLIPTCIPRLDRPGVIIVTAYTRDVNKDSRLKDKDWTCKDKDQGLEFKDR